MNDERKDLNLADLKKDARKLEPQTPQGELVESIVGTTVGGQWWENDKNPNVVTDSTGKDVHLNGINAYSSGGTEHVKVDEQSTSVKQYEGPGFIVDNEDLKEKPPVKMNKPGEPIDLDDKINTYLKDYVEEASEIHEKVVESEESIKIAEPSLGKVDDEVDYNKLSNDEFNDKYEEAIVYIDKTKMGTVIQFSDAEHAKMEKAKKITLQEVESKDLKTLKIKGRKKGIETLINRRQSLHSTNIVLPASGYTAVMKGCSPYELMEIVADTKNEVMNQEMKWSLIHRKIESTSIGNMDFDTFLNRTASIDYNVLLYGILCATYPDDDTFPLVCQNKKCKSNFNHNYSIKSLIRAESMTEELGQTFMNIVDASNIVETAKETHECSPVRTTLRLTLPVSEMILDIGVQSAYDFLYKSIKELKDKIEDKYAQAAITSSIVRKLYIEDDDIPGEFYEYDMPSDITKAIYSLNAIDIKILNKKAEALFKDLQFEFGLMNVKCPKCGESINTVPVDVETILFYKYQQDLATKID